MFDNTGESSDGHKHFVYFYVNGTQKVYRLDRDRHWTVWIKSYITDTNSMIERKLVRSKYKFNMAKYSTIDEAIRDLIDMVSTYRTHDLTASIFGELPFSKDLHANIQVKELHHWVKRLNGMIRGMVHTSYDVSGAINGIYFNDSTDIMATVSGTDWTPPEGNDLIFNFENAGYSPPVYDDADLIWTGDDAR